MEQPRRGEGGMSLYTLTALPWDALERVFFYLPVDDLGRLCRVCKYFHSAIPACNKLWKVHCKLVWLMEELEVGSATWHDQWMEMIGEFGAYRDCYATVKETWRTIEGFLSGYPNEGDGFYNDLSNSLRAGLTEEEITAAEAKLGFLLPTDFRCSLRFHDGQNMANPASFLGGLQFYSFSTMLIFFPLQLMIQFHCDHNNSGYNPWRNNKQYVQIASSIACDYTFVMALEGCKFTPPGHVVQVAVVDWYRHRMVPQVLDHFPNSSIVSRCSVGLIGEAKSFKDWLFDHAKKLSQYPVLEKTSILRFYCNPDWAVSTRHFTVKVGTALDPTLGRWNHQEIMFARALPLLFKGGSYAYWVIIKMHEDAPEEESCQLLTRHWLIRYASSREERVEGDGVIGENPIFKPGKVFQYASCTNFIAEEYCTMEGHYTMKYLNKPGVFSIRIPQFHMPLPKVIWA